MKEVLDAFRSCEGLQACCSCSFPDTRGSTLEKDAMLDDANAGFATLLLLSKSLSPTSLSHVTY
jgi:hypothetical protein